MMSGLGPALEHKCESWGAVLFPHLADNDQFKSCEITVTNNFPAINLFVEQQSAYVDESCNRSILIYCKLCLHIFNNTLLSEVR